MVNNNKAFTIVELGVVIVLFLLIARVLGPFVGNVRTRAMQVRCVNNLQKISIALRAFAYENDGKVPDDISLLLTRGYLDSEKVFDCPFSSRKGTAANPDYVYKKKFNFETEGDFPIVYDQQGNHPDGSSNVLYLNGEIRNESPE